MQKIALVVSSVCVVGSLCGCAYPTRPSLPPGIFVEEVEREALPQGESLRKVYATGLQATKDAEYFVPTLYNDVAHYCTIGYGHLIKRLPCDGSEPSEFRNGITEQRGTDLLIKDMETAEVSVMLAVKPDLTDGQYAALCDFAFNVGTKHFKDSTLLQVVNAEQFDRVPAQFRRWTIAGGKPVKGLANRREREISVFFDGLPIPKGAPSLGEDMSPIDIRAGEDADGQ